MNALDRLAALAIILQLCLMAFFGVALTRHLALQEALLRNIEAKVYATPTPSPAVITTSPVPSSAVNGGLPKGVSSGSAVNIVRPTK